MNTVEILNDIAEELTQHPERWCQGVTAKDKNGLPVKAMDPEAVTWCIFGHIGRRVEVNALDTPAALALRDYLYPNTGTSTVQLSGYNDYEHRKVGDIVSACKGAAKLI